MKQPKSGRVCAYQTLGGDRNMYSRFEIEEDLVFLERTKIISSSEKNLRSKIDSIIRSIENLTEKKLRIEFEIKKQKLSLERKRLELKKSHKTTKVKVKAALESGSIQVTSEGTDPNMIDNYLLRVSHQILEQD